MGTPRRIQYPGAIYHVTVHSLDELWPFAEARAREQWLVEVDRALRGRAIECHAYCVMSNHFHLLLRTTADGLPEAMQQLDSNVARAYNRAHKRRGRVLLAPYHTKLIENQAHLHEVARYDVLNPVRAGLVRDAADWPWSSYRATAGLACRPPFLTTDWVLGRVGGVERYRRFVAAGCPATTVDSLLLAA